MTDLAEEVAPGVARVRPAVFRSISAAAPTMAAPAAAPEESSITRGPGALRAYQPTTGWNPGPLREARSGGLVGTAPVANPPPAATMAPAPTSTVSDIEGHLAPLRGLSRELVNRGMTAALTAELLAEIVAEFGDQVLTSEQDARLALVEQILLRIAGEPLLPVDTPITGAYMVTGPAGAGKSVLIAHLAMAAAEQGQREVVLVNTEGERLGAAAQMDALGMVFGYRVEHLYTPQDLHNLRDHCGQETLLLVEAAGWTPAGGSDRQRNAWTWQLPNATNVICVPATSQAEDLHELLTTVRQTMRNPIAALCKTRDTRNLLPALGALAGLRQQVGMVVPGPNLIDAGTPPDLAMLTRTAMGVVTLHRKKGRVWC